MLPFARTVTEKRAFGESGTLCQHRPRPSAEKRKRTARDDFADICARYRPHRSLPQRPASECHPRNSVRRPSWRNALSRSSGNPREIRLQHMHGCPHRQFRAHVTPSPSAGQTRYHRLPYVSYESVTGDDDRTAAILCANRNRERKTKCKNKATRSPEYEGKASDIRRMPSSRATAQRRPERVPQKTSATPMRKRDRCSACNLQRKAERYPRLCLRLSFFGGERLLRVVDAEWNGIGARVGRGGGVLLTRQELRCREPSAARSASTSSCSSCARKKWCCRTCEEDHVNDENGGSCP